MKKCSKCGEAKPLEAFHKNRASKDGLQSYCAVCRAAYCAGHAKEIAAYGKVYNAGHKEEKAAWMKAYRAANAEVIAAKKKTYNAEHKEERAATQKARRAERREEIAAYNKAYRDEHAVELAARQRDWRKANPEKAAEYKHRRRARLASATVAPIDIMDVWERGARVCVYCGATENLSIDHIMPLARGGSHSPDNLCVACKSCNSSKGAKPLIGWLAGRERLDLLEQGGLI